MRRYTNLRLPLSLPLPVSLFFVSALAERGEPGKAVKWHVSSYGHCSNTAKGSAVTEILCRLCFTMVR